MRVIQYFVSTTKQLGNLMSRRVADIIYVCFALVADVAVKLTRLLRRSTVAPVQ